MDMHAQTEVRSSTSIVLRDLWSKRLQRAGKLRRVTMEEVKLHNTKDDGWIVVDGWVSLCEQHVGVKPP
jgi:cytochrome b involved in lipid metabolism